MYAHQQNLHPFLKNAKTKLNTPFNLEIILHCSIINTHGNQIPPEFDNLYINIKWLTSQTMRVIREYKRIIIKLKSKECRGVLHMLKM